MPNTASQAKKGTTQTYRDIQTYDLLRPRRSSSATIIQQHAIEAPEIRIEECTQDALIRIDTGEQQGLDPMFRQLPRELRVSVPEPGDAVLGYENITV